MPGKGRRSNSLTKVRAILHNWDIEIVFGERAVRWTFSVVHAEDSNQNTAGFANVDRRPAYLVSTDSVVNHLDSATGQLFKGKN